MPLKDILVHVDSGAAARERLGLALKLSDRHAAHLKAVYVMTHVRTPPHVEARLPREVIEMQEAALRDEAAAAERAAVAQAQQAGIPLEWISVRGAVLPQVSLHGRYADLTIIGQAAEDDPGAAFSAELPGSLPLALGRPVLVVPRYGQFSTVGERPLVAWNGSREGTRALADSMPILELSKETTVLSVLHEGAEEGLPPGADVALHLARHGIKAEASTFYAGGDLTFGDAILSRAADLGSDLIVMGAYGHARLTELILGGVTRTILNQMTVPVLMSH